MHPEDTLSAYGMYINDELKGIALIRDEAMEVAYYDEGGMTMC